MKDANDICAMLSKAYEREAMKKSSVSVWHKCFKEGHENVEDGERSCPRSHRTDENVEKVWNLVYSDKTFKYQSYDYATKLDKETAMCVEK